MRQNELFEWRKGCVTFTSHEMNGHELVLSMFTGCSLFTFNVLLCFGPKSNSSYFMERKIVFLVQAIC